MKRRHRSLDDLLPLVFVAFALLCGSALVYETTRPLNDQDGTSAQA